MCLTPYHPSCSLPQGQYVSHVPAKEVHALPFEKKNILVHRAMGTELQLNQVFNYRKTTLKINSS